jgi:hypothetical protein
MRLSQGGDKEWVAVRLQYLGELLYMALVQRIDLQGIYYNDSETAAVLRVQSYKFRASSAFAFGHFPDRHSAAA